MPSAGYPNENPKAMAQLGPAFEFTVPKSYKTVSSTISTLTTINSKRSSLLFAKPNALSPRVLKTRNENIPINSQSNAKFEKSPITFYRERPSMERPIARTTTATTTVTIGSGKIAKRVPSGALEFHRKRKLLPPIAPFSHSSIIPSPLFQSYSPPLSDTLDAEKDLLKICTNSAQAMGRYIMNRRSMNLSSSPPKPTSNPSLTDLSNKGRAQRLRIRLRLAYYKVLTNQTNLPLKRLPSPESPDTESYTFATPLYSLAKPAEQYTRYTAMRSSTTSVMQSTPIRSEPDCAQTPPLSTGSTMTIKSASWQTPVKQQLYQFQLTPDSDAYSSAKKYSSSNSLCLTPSSIKAAKSLLQLGSQS